MLADYACIEDAACICFVHDVVKDDILVGFALALVRYLIM